MKRFLSITLVLSMLLAVCPLGAFNAFAETYSGTCGYNSNVTWSFDTETGTLTISGEGEMADYAYSSYTPWYDYKNSIIRVEIEDGVTKIGESVFSSCTNLTSVIIPNSVTKIGPSAFYNCTSLTAVIIPDSVTQIGNDAFNACASMTSLTIGNGVNTIGDSAFSNCTSLTSVTIPGSVTSFGAGVFNYCTGLTSVIVGEGITYMGKSVFADCSSLTSVTLPDSLLSINEYTFAACTSLTSITIPDGVAGIGGYAFRECTSLANITIGSNVKRFADGVFYKCESLTSITIPDSLTYVGNATFWYCDNIKSVYINDIKSWLNIQFDGQNSNPLSNGADLYLNNVKVTDLVVPDGMTSIGDGVFKGYKSLTSVTFPNSVTKIGERSFSGCSGLTSIYLPDSITTIGNSAFSGCTNMASINIPYGISSIGSSTFSACYSLTSINIPDSVTSIGDYAFYNCNSLTDVTIPDSVTSIGREVFAYCDDLTRVTIGSGVDIISTGSFQDCDSLISVTISNGTTSIENYAFSGCISLTSIKIPDSVTIIHSYAFRNCYNLTNVILGGNVTRIWTGAFSNCTNLTIITVPVSVTTVDSSAFEGCKSIKTVFYGGSEEDWDNIKKDEHNNYYFLSARIMFNSSFWNSSSTEHTVRVVDSSGEPIENATVEIIRKGKSAYHTTNKEGYVNFYRGFVTDLDITVTADGYETETTVGKNFALSDSGLDVFTLYTPEEAVLKLKKAVYQDTNSSYNEVLGFDVNLVKGTKRLSMTNASKGYFRILCGTSDASKVEKYTLYQNGRIIKISENGVFNLSIAEFSAGKNVYVTVFGKDGKKVTTHLNLEICDDTPVKDASISFGDAISFTVPESVPFVGGDKITCDIPDMPIEFELEDGKLYAGLNVDFTEDESVKEQYDKLKKTMSDVKKLSNYKVGNHLNGNIAEFLKKREKFKMPVAGDVEVALFGGGEVTWSENGVDGMKLQAYLVVDASLKKNWQTAVWVIPVTIQIKVGIEGKLEAVVDWDFNTQTANGDVTLNLKPYLNAFGGVGVGEFVGVGVYGDADVDFEIQLFGTTVSPGLNSVDLTGELGMKAYVGPLVYEKAFAHNTWHIYTRTDAVNYASSTVTKYYNGAFDSKNYAVDDVSYLKNQSEWLGDWIPLKDHLANGASSETIEINPMLESTYRNLQPSVAANGNTAVMVYVGADTEREAQNIPVVMYSVYDAEKGIWLEPVQVDSNETADAVPVLYSDGETIRLVYQDASKVYGEDFTETEYLTTQNIVAYVYDEETNTFVLEETFAPENTQYRTPKIATVDGVPTMVWIASENSDILGQGGDNAFMYSSCVDGVWSEPSVLADALSTVPDYAVGAINGKLSVLYSADADNDLATDTDRSLNLLDADGSTTVGNTVASNLDFVKLPSEANESFVWVYDSILNTLNESNEVESVCTVGSPESIAIVGDKILFTAGSTTENGEANSEIFAVVYDKTSESYGEAVQLSVQDRHIEKIDAINFNGTEIVTMTRKAVEITEANVTDDCELSWAVLNGASDLKIDNVEYTYSEIQDNVLPMYVSVANKGTVATDRYVISVKDDMGNTVYTQSYEEGLLAGETRDITLELPLDGINSVEEFSVVIGETAEKADDAYAFTIGEADLKITTESIKVGTQNTLVCTVSNEGLSSASGTLLVYEGSEDNIVYEGTVETLAPGEQCTFVVDLTFLTTERILTCVVKSDVEDYSEANDAESIYFDFSVLSEAECQHIWEECVCIGCGETNHVYDNSCDGDCNACGETRTVSHSYESVVTEPTCTEGGYTTHTCETCGDSYIDSETDALGHTEGEWETLPDGSKELYCTSCGELLDSEAAPAYEVGDVNADGKINMFDYMKIKSHHFDVITLTDAEFARADISGDGKVNMFDYMKIKTIVFAS